MKNTEFKEKSIEELQQILYEKKSELAGLEKKIYETHKTLDLIMTERENAKKQYDMAKFKYEDLGKLLEKKEEDYHNLRKQMDEIKCLLAIITELKMKAESKETYK